MKQQKQASEVWMRGPVPGIPPLLQPVAHTLLQVLEDVKYYTASLENRSLWRKKGNVATVGFHLQHIPGVIDRMFTYAMGLPLSEEQFIYLRSEGQENFSLTIEELIKNLDKKIEQSLETLGKIDEQQLTEVRYLGRDRIPTTLIGLLFHAAEHAQRHVGQLLVTSKLLGPAF